MTDAGGDEFAFSPRTMGSFVAVGAGRAGVRLAASGPAAGARATVVFALTSRGTIRRVRRTVTPGPRSVLIRDPWSGQAGRVSAAVTVVKDQPRATALTLVHRTVRIR